MPRKFIPVGKMSTDTWGWGSDGAWFLENIIGFGDTYTSVGKLAWNASEANTPYPIQGAYLWRTNWNTKREFWTVNNQIYEVGVGSVAAGLTNNTYYGTFFAPFGPSIFMTNGVNPIKISTTGAFTSIAPVAVTGNTFADIRPKFLITFKNQLVAANIHVQTTYGALPSGDYPHLVWWSARGDGEMWGDFDNAPDIDGTNYIPIFDDSVEITGLAAGEDCVFVFKEHSIHRLDGPDFAVSPVSHDVGCVAPKTICKVGKMIYFLSANGIYEMDAESGAHRNIGEGKVSRTLTGSNAIPEVSDPNLPSDTLATTVKIGVGIADDGITMAADPDNKILVMVYRPFNTGSLWRTVFYNILTEQWSFGNLDLTTVKTTGGGTTDLHIYRGSRAQSTNAPLGSLRFVCNDTLGDVRTGYFTVWGCDTGSRPYIRYPFGFYNPEGDVKITSVKPIFDHTYEDGTHGTLVVNAQVTTVNNIGGNYVDDGQVWNPIGNGNDWNFTFDSPFASRHSISVEWYNSDGDSYVYNIVGVEVEYEEKVLTSK